MFPFRTSTIFRNRWFAVLWAAGICYTAAQFAEDRRDGDALGSDINRAQINAAIDQVLK